MTQNCWMIRAGHGGKLVNDFKDKNLVAIGWGKAGDFSKLPSRQSLVEHIAKNYPDNSQHQNRAAAGQIFRFLHEINVGDAVLTYDSIRRIYLFGKINSGPTFNPSLLDGLYTYRTVEWTGEISRDLLSATTRNTLGGIMTLFKLSPEAMTEISSRIDMQDALSDFKIDINEAEDLLEDESDYLEDLKAKSKESIKDKISKFNWEQMQTLVADILVGMGYKTLISPPGSDRGKDIIASRDGFGFEQPRIVVEVKHRKEAMAAPEIRSFLGGRHKDDKGLYVSTGGFTTQARYEAERASIPLTLWDLNDLVQAFIDNYESMPMRGRTLIPLAKIYWPLNNN